MNDRLTGAGLAGSAAVAVGTSFVASAVLVSYPFVLGQALRYGAAALVLLVALAVLRRPLVRPTGREWRQLALLAATGQVGFNLATLAALRTAEPAAVGVVVGCVPIVLGVFDPLRRRRSPSRRLVAAAVVVVVGAAIVQGFGHTDALGLLFALGALLGEAAFSLVAVPLLPRLGHLNVAMYACMLATAELGVLVVATMPFEHVRLPTSSETRALAYLSVVVTAGAFAAWYAGLRRLGAEQAGLFAGVIPVSAALTAPIAGVGTLGLAQAVGCFVVGLGVAYGMTSPRAHRRHRQRRQPVGARPADIVVGAERAE